VRRGDETEKGERGKKGGGRKDKRHEGEKSRGSSLLTRLYRVSASRRWSSRHAASREDERNAEGERVRG